ncbi:MAG: hypothetical protein WA814_08740 [Candidatus Baltobacteraceae bacterium]
MKNARALLASFAFFAIASAQLAPAFAADSATVNLMEQNGSGESGTATLTQVGPDVNVVIALKGAPATAQPAHIHNGVCSDLGGVAYPLTNVVGGSSTTLVKGVTVASLTSQSQPFSINVHLSAAQLDKYVACGQLFPSSM